MFYNHIYTMTENTHMLVHCLEIRLQVTSQTNQPEQIIHLFVIPAN